MSRIRKKSEELPVPYTDEELAVKRDELATLVLAESDVRARKKATLHAFKEELEDLIGLRHKIAHQVKRKTELRPVDCRIELHTPTVGMKRIIRLDTGELLREEQMTAEELQEELFSPDEFDKLFDNGDEPQPPEQPGAAA